MKTTKREFTKNELEMFLLKDKDGDYLKNPGIEKDHYNIEPGVEGAQIFTEAEAMEQINFSEEEFFMESVADVINVDEYEFEEEIV